MLTASREFESPWLNGIRNHPWRVAFVTPMVVLPCVLTSGGALLGLLVLLLITSTITDILHRKIYNWLTYPAVGWAFGLSLANAVVAGEPIAAALADCLIGAVGCFGLMLVPYWLARGGAGDVKLAAAIGAIVGFDAGVLAIAFTYIIAGLAIGLWSVGAQGPLTLSAAVLRRVGSALFPNRIAAPSERQSLILDQPVPLAPFFALGTLCVMFDVPALLRSL